jgi:hypothetical protein
MIHSNISNNSYSLQHDIVNSSIKKDKLHQIIYNYQQQNDLRKQLLVIKNLADNYPNSGSLNKALNNFDKDLQNILTMKDKNLLCTTELVSILTSIALKNPEIYQTFAFLYYLIEIII